MKYHVELFFELFCDSRKRLTIFIFGNFVEVSLRRFKTLSGSFMMFGTEYIISGGLVERVK